MRAFLGLTAVLATILLAGCGGEGGDGGTGALLTYLDGQGSSSSGGASSGTTSGTSTSSGGGSLTLSGRVTYDKVPVSTSGLLFSSSQTTAAKGVVVMLWRNGTVIARTNTDATGTYAFSGIDSGSTVRVTAMAQLGNPSNPDVKVLDNTASDAEWGIYADFTMGTADKTDGNLHAASGWSGSSYTGTRYAAPFAIADVIYKAQTLVRSGAPNLVFPYLAVFWSPLNDDGEPINYPAGDILTSHYTDGKIYIKGAAASDTDEFDEVIIAHEWSHYFTDKFSRDDSLGGGHSLGQLLDEPTAFSEGFATAQGAIICGTRYYTDTYKTATGWAGYQVDIEADYIIDSSTWPGDTRRRDGGWSETSVWEVLYDIMDGGTGDDDALALGYSGIYSAMTGSGVLNAPGFASIYSFLSQLKTSNSTYASQIATIAQAENIGNHDAYELLAAADKRYTAISAMDTDVTTDSQGQPLQGSIFYDTTDFDNNKLISRQFFTCTVPTTGTHSITVTPLVSGGQLSISAPGVYSAGLTSGGQPRTVTFTTEVANDLLVFGVGLYNTSINVPYRVRVNTGATAPAPGFIPAKPIGSPQRWDGAPQASN